MTHGRVRLKIGAAVCCVALVGTGCSFDGINSLPLPGTVASGSDAARYRVKVANVGTLEPNSPVLVDDVIVGSIRDINVEGWHAVVDVAVRRGTPIPGNVVATVGQTSLLGSMHLALDPPLGEPPEGSLGPGSTIGLTASSAYPSTERTLSTLSAVANGGGLGQLGDIVRSFNTALNGRQGEARDLLSRLDRFVGVLDDQQHEVLATMQAMERLAGTMAGQRDVIRRAFDEIPPALDILIAERPEFTKALDKLRAFSDATTAVVDDTQADLVTNLSNLDPTLRALADVGPEIDTALAFLPVMPFGQNLIDRGIRGDYMNLFAVMDLTVPRLKRTLFSGTRWGDEHAQLVPAPGDPGYDAFYTREPLQAPLASTAPPPSGSGAGSPTPETPR